MYSRYTTVHDSEWVTWVLHDTLHFFLLGLIILRIFGGQNKLHTETLLSFTKSKNK